MAYRIKDLLINVISASDAKRRFGNCMASVTDPRVFTTHECGTNTTKVCRLLWAHPWFCGTSTTWPGPVAAGDPVEWVEQLAILKAELKEALEEVERQEAAAEQALTPRDIPEIDSLANKLKEGLTELARLRSELERKK